MAVITGFIAQVGVGGEYAPGNITSDFRDFADDWWPLHSSIISGILTSTVTSNLPVSANPVVKSGFISGAYSDDFYHRIHVIPRAIDVGNLVSSQSRTIYVWNAFLVAKTLQSFTGTDVEGMSMVQPVTLPASIYPLRVLTYTLNISLEGPSVINGYYTWTFEGEPSVITVTGRRVVVIPIEPNWKNPFVEGLEWKTDILRAYSGKEQRRATRTKARRTFEFGFLVKEAKAQRLENLLWGWQNRNYAVPVWSDRSPLTAQAAIGATTIALDTSTQSFSESALIGFKMADGTFDVVEINSVGINTITLTLPNDRLRPVGTPVYPVVLGHLPTEVPLVRHTDRAVSGVLSFATSPDEIGPYTPAGTAATVYDGLEVITKQPNWKSGLNITSEYQFQTQDAGMGAIAYQASERTPRIIRSHAWLLRSRQQVLDFRKFLARQNGRQKTCWVPTWYDDLTLLQTIPFNGTGAVVADRDFRLLVGVDTSRDRIMIRLKTGQVIYRKILDVQATATPGEAQLTLDSAPGVDVVPSNVKAPFLS